MKGIQRMFINISQHCVISVNRLGFYYIVFTHQIV